MQFFFFALLLDRKSLFIFKSYVLRQRKMNLTNIIGNKFHFQQIVGTITSSLQFSLWALLTDFAASNIKRHCKALLKIT